jgi:peptide/nickel transport system substrate-binding protein
MVAHTEIREANIFNVKGPSQCLIATATYGSDLAPEVQLLREFRDQAIGTTFAGENFLLAFNTWYYSFSPSVASQIRVDSPLQTGMQALLVPLLLSLKAGAVVFDTPVVAQPELAVMLGGLLASGLIGIAYLSAPVFVLNTRYPRMKRATRPLLIAFTVGLSGLAVAELLANGYLAAFSSTTLILANMLLFALLPSTILDRARRLL